MTLHPFLDWPGPIPFAHRGGAVDRPENTFEAFAAAVDLGYRHLETDAHVTADGVVMAFHDDSLDRVSDRRGRIVDLTCDEVEAADAGYSYSDDGGVTFPHRGTGLRVPRLERILTAWPDVRVNIDAKSDAVVEPLAALLLSLDVLDRVCVGSFSDGRLARMRRLCGPRLCTSMGPRAVTVARLASWTGRIPHMRAMCLQVPLRHGRAPLVDAVMVRAAHRSGLRLHVWTIDDPAVMERLLDLGVDGIMTDRPAALRDVLLSRGAWFGG